MTELKTSAVPAAFEALYLELDAIEWEGRRVDVLLTSDVWDQSRECVLLGEVRGDQEWALLGARSKDEEFTVDLFVVVRWPGHVRLEAATRAWEILAQVERLLADPAYIALAQSAGVQWNALTSPIGTPTVEDEGAGYVVKAMVKFKSRITPRGA